MKSILVVDDMAVFREPIAATLRLAGYKTLCACDGGEALALMRSERPGLVLLDVCMPKMDGIAFLKQMRTEPAISSTPVILLTALGEKKYILAAAALGANDYLLKSRFQLKDFLQRIERMDNCAVMAGDKGVVGRNDKQGNPGLRGTSDAASGKVSGPSARQNGGKVQIPTLLSREQFLERIEGIFQAKALSGVIAQVIALANSPRGDATQLASLIARDAMLSARVLQVANSAAYTSGGIAVTNVSDAIRKIGSTAVRNIAAALGVFECIPDPGTDGFNPIRYWQHSFAVAQLCERLAAGGPTEQAGLAYVVGLCHDLGDIFIRTQFASEYQQIMDMADQTGRSKEQLYSQMLGVSEAQMISAIFKHMALPEAIRKPIELFHSPATSARASDPLAQILLMAESYANATLLASSMSSEIAPLTQSSCRAVTGDQSSAWPDPQTLRAEVVSLTTMLAKLSRAEEAKLLVPLVMRQSCNIWLARHRQISKYDPISIVLESITQVTISDRLPTSEEIEQMDGLVVIAPSCNTAGYAQIEIDSLVARARAKGREMPLLCCTCDTPNPTEALTWHTSFTLGELASFVAPQAAKENL